MPRRRWLRLTATTLSKGVFLFGVLVLVASSTPLVKVWAASLANPWYDSGHCQTLIVLGGAESEDGVLGYSSYWRSVYAVRAYRAHPFKRIFISGGSGSTPSTAESMALFLAASGVPSEIIRLDSKSKSTRENALFTFRVIGAEPGCKELMTSDFHTFRASRAFREVGMDVRPTPVPDALKRSSSWNQRWLVLFDVAVETAKIVVYKWRGWI